MNYLTAKDLLSGYRIGIFPMAVSKNSKEIFWVKPDTRGIMPIGKLHVSRSLKKFIRSNSIDTTINQCFSEVVEHCANRTDTWINSELNNIYQELYDDGCAVSIEIWLNKKLIGGLFGVTVGSCFCGESMFSLHSNGSKLALVVTMARLNYNKFKLFDTQFTTTHLKSMGGCEITQLQYEQLLLSSANEKQHSIYLPDSFSWSEIMQLNNHKLYR